MVSQKARRTSQSTACLNCGRVFSRPDSLTRHRRLHDPSHERTNAFRITAERFRACVACRTARTRCSGSNPCSRCDRNSQECRYPPTGIRRTSVKDSTSPEREAASESQPCSPDLPTPLSMPQHHDQNVHSSSIDISSTSRQEGLRADSQAQYDTPPYSTPSQLNVHPDFGFLGGHLSDGDDAIPTLQRRPSGSLEPVLEIGRPSGSTRSGIFSEDSGPWEADCRYPVLHTLAVLLQKFLALDTACDLLDVYFSSAFPHRLHPTCHYIHAFILRRTDVLQSSKPRRTHPALLASMLWVASLSDRAEGLFAIPADKDLLSAKLSALTFRLLKPEDLGSSLERRHLGLSQAFADPISWADMNGFGDLVASQERENTLGPVHSLDHVVAYIHVSSIISASEEKAASIQWWQATFQLARRLQLNIEPTSIETPNDEESTQAEGPAATLPENIGAFASTIEVYQEERRRTWWLLFAMDRHLAFCYNRPLALLEDECRDLFLPLDDIVWQSNVISPERETTFEEICRTANRSSSIRRKGPPLTCTGHSLYESFLPLMTITGHLIDLNRTNLSSDATSKASSERYDRLYVELDQFQDSLDHYCREQLSLHAGSEVPFIEEHRQFIRIVWSYSKHILYVLRILLCGRWDPVCLFEDADYWTSSAKFKESISYTMAATGCVSQILVDDPDVSFMPYFFGIQLLHGSLLLLLMAYRLRADSGHAFLTACETVIQATEACLVTLRTEYQRQFRNIMRAAINLAKGRVANPVETEKQVVAVLARYRWSQSGGGLAR